MLRAGSSCEPPPSNRPRRRASPDREGERLHLSINILTYRNPGFLDAQLHSLRGQLRPGDEIVVIEDGPCDGTAEVVEAHREHLAIRHVWHEDDGRRLCLARNRSILESRHPLILFLDHDVIFRPRSIERLRRTIRPGWALGLRRVMLDDATTKRIVEDQAHLRPSFWPLLPWRALLGRWKGWRFLLPLRRRDCRGPSNDWRGCATFGFLCHREDLVAVNGFDTRCDGESYAEDWDLFARLRHSGVSFGHPDHLCSVGHLEHGRSDHSLESRNYRLLEEVERTSAVRARVGLEEMQASSGT